MKTTNKVTQFIKYPLLSVFLYSERLLAADDLTIPDPGTGALFGADTKVVKGLMSIDMFVKAGTGIFALMCFISSANAARSGQYGRSAGAFLGGIIAALAGYLVTTVRT